MFNPTGLQSLGPSRSPEALQQDLRRVVKDGHRILKSLCTQLQRMEHLNILGDDGRGILEKIEKARKFEVRPCSIIAFIGESGVGKSTLLSALVDYENIVPTSGIRACTSCATEFSKRLPGMEAVFNAVIEYATLDESKEEMEILSEDIQDETDVQNIYSGDESDDEFFEPRPTKKVRRSDVSSTDAYKIALSKLVALFPDFQESDIKNVVGKLEKLYEESDCLQSGRLTVERDEQERFVTEMHRLISGRGSNNDEAQLWPLVKTVKIYLDSPVLETGAVLVDLPGLQDNNPARTSVAQKYLQKADKIIVVSRLSRILTNDTATALAQMGYAKQLKLDGRKSITMVATCCDQFDPNDAKNEFGMVDGFSKTYNELDKKARKPSRQELQGLNPDERKSRIEAAEVAKNQLKEFCDSFRDQYVPTRIAEEYSKFLGEGTEIKCFLVASKQYQDLDPDSEDAAVQKTQIPQLRDYCRRVSMNQSAQLVKNFIHFDVLRSVSDVRVLVEDLGSLREQIRKCICADLETAAFNMKEALDKLEVACDKRISKCRDDIMKEIEALAERGIPHCQNVLQAFYKLYQSNTFRAVCRRGGVCNNPKQPKRDLNRRFLDSMEHGILELQKYCWVDIEESLSIFTASVVMLLGGFKGDWAKIIDRECPNPTAEITESRNAFLSSLDAMSFETSKLLMEQTRRVKYIQQEITSSALSIARVKSAMKSSYETAARASGKGAYGKMLEAVGKGIKQSNIFVDIKASIAQILWNLAFVLNVENVTWCFDFQKVLKKSIKQWTAVSQMVGQVEGKEKDKLRFIVADIEKRRAQLVLDVEKFEKETDI
ncbi:hypothetical protein AOL_s00054g830 [Orbilia oligospora ATCC 24927]|uniref:Uncharacterized protein n=1 Tax=Arthrobotrys oligospora (strain ATCC 24927 / CBS 115.81 / DSM 1491) TaxID=756982 RepID=G1X7U4_ARTOA|nr:hypothetical protein AOL_s00054g830 [Orbilia oligospora ATCC 24927]EGX50744.1 hypothetical protein AOL_s00054g830 [Orbilia oligospora ATCC 24927]